MTEIERVADFIVIGAMRAGTTALFTYLVAHPDVGGSDRKETGWFTRSDSEDAAGYARHFRGRHELVVGEASPHYTMWPTHGDVAGRVHAIVPDARLVYVLRDRAGRMRSHYRHEVLRSRETRPPALALADPAYMHASLYGEQLERYLRHFAPDRLQLVANDELARGREAVVRAIWSFIGVDPDRGIVRTDEVFRTDDRHALSPGVERIRRTRLAQAVSGRLDPRWRARATGLVATLRGGSDDRRVAPLLAEAEAWRPPEALIDRFRVDQEQLVRAAEGCALVGFSSDLTGLEP